MIKCSELNENEFMCVQVEMKIRKIVGYLSHRQLSMGEIQDLAQLNIIRAGLNKQDVLYEDIERRYESGIR